MDSSKPDSKLHQCGTARSTIRLNSLVQVLQGGIGNQLFQIAATIKLAARLGLQPAFDIGRYKIDAFGRKSVLDRVWPGAATIDLRGCDPARLRLVREIDGVLRPDALPAAGWNLPDGIDHLVLDGYWQDDRWLDDKLLAVLRKHLRTDFECHPEWAAQAAQMRNSACAVAVHVRRHDYQHHGLCIESYYLDSLRWIADSVPDLDVYVFTDEPNYTRYFLARAGIRPKLIATGDDLVDLYLMSQCTRLVISNSTYSWWGARLANASLVIWPAPWSAVHEPSPFLCPAHWHRLNDAVRPGDASPRFMNQLEAIAHAAQDSAETACSQ